VVFKLLIIDAVKLTAGEKMIRQRTLKSSIRTTGVGLHTGDKIQLSQPLLIAALCFAGWI
jgi:hypothetical protein